MCDLVVSTVPSDGLALGARPSAGTVIKSTLDPYVYFQYQLQQLTHSGWVMHIYIIKLTITGSDNGLSPGQCQAIIWTTAEILSIRTSGTNFNEILSKIHAFHPQKCCLHDRANFVSALMY